MPSLVDRLTRDQRRAYKCASCLNDMSFLYFQLSASPTKANPSAVRVLRWCKFCYKVRYQKHIRARTARYYARGGRERAVAYRANPRHRPRIQEYKRLYRERLRLRSAPEEEEKE